MECKESEQLMMADVDAELDDATVVRLRAHLATCSACRAAHTALTRLQQEIKHQTTVYVAPSHLRHRIIEALPREQARRKFVARPWGWRHFTATAFSAVLVTTVVLRLSTPTSTPRLEQEVVNSHFRSLLANHLTDVLSSDQHTVKPWFTGKLDFSPPVFDFSLQGFPLIGGRLDYVAGRTVAALVYRRNKHVVNVFLWPEQGASAALQMRSRQGFQLAEWSAGGFRYEAVSDVNAQELTELKHLLDLQVNKTNEVTR